MFKNIACLVVLLFSLKLIAQNPQQKSVTISGKIMDKASNTPLEYATIIFTNKNNTKAITGGITNSNGNYAIAVVRGTYIVSVEYIGYKTIIIGDKKIVKDENYGTFFLEENAEALEGIELVAETTTVEIKLDKKIYNVGKDLTVRGGTVSDVLDNVPSVSVDVEGNVSLRGNDNVRILINGKPSGLVGLNSTDALRQLPAESIAKVEVITSPSARYDAEGTGGILNIILRRSKLQGLNGAITTNIGYNPSAGISGNLNYRTGDLNIFNTSGYNYREVPGNNFSNTINFEKVFDAAGNVIEDNPDTFSEEKNSYDRERKGLNTNLGLEWYINESATITGSILYSDNDNQNNVINTLKIFDTNRNLTSSTLRIDPEIETGKTIQYAVNFNKQFKTSGHKLTFDFQYEDNNEDESSLVNVDGLDTETVATLEDSETILLQTDYVLPIGNNSQFELGYRGNFNTRNTDYSVAFLDENTNAFVNDTGLSNIFNYREYLTAFYTQYGSKIGKFSYLLGLRLEDTQITLDQPTTGDFRKNKYTGLFPTVNLNYELNKSENITLAYNRRIRRPRSFFVNPFPSRSSVTSIFQGNPALAPSYSGQLDLGYLKRFGKFTFDTSIYYSRATDVFNFIIIDTGETVMIDGEDVPVFQRTPINLATQDRTGFEFTLTYRASKKWNINTNFNFFQFKTEGIAVNGDDLGNENSSWFFRINNKYTLPGSIEWQTRLRYNGPREENGQSSREGIFVANLAFSKDLFNDKASLAFNINDLLNSRKRQQITTTNTFTSDSEFQWRERSFNLSFTYRFNQKKKRKQRRNYGGNDDFEE